MDSYLLVLSCLLVSVRGFTGPVLPPQNVTMRWIEDFKVQLTWEPPPHPVDNCTFQVVANGIIYQKTPSYTHSFFHREEPVSGSITTICNGKESSPLDIKDPSPTLVRGEDLQCSIYSSTVTNCSWILARPAADLGFFYRLLNEGSSEGEEETTWECPRYGYSATLRTSCELQASANQTVVIIINGTVEGKPARNTFYKSLNVTPSPNWTVINTGDNFKIDWTYPDIGKPDQWILKIKYKECNEYKEMTLPRDSPHTLARNRDCHYCLELTALWRKKKVRGTRSSQWCFEPDVNLWLYAMIIIPLTFASLVALVFMCFKRNKDQIFPKIPEPSNLLKDFYDNNNKSSVCNLHVPPEEEGDCEITLVIDPLNGKVPY